MEPISKALVLASAGLLGGLVSVSTAMAQQVPTSDASTTRLGTVKVVGHGPDNGQHSYQASSSSIADKTATPYMEQSQTTNTVTPQQLRDQNPQNIEEATSYVPGIAIGNNFGGAQENLIKRGFAGGSNDGSILTDGVRMPIGLTYLPETVDRVEVLKGPSSLLYGMQDPGGVINIITKKPEYTRSTTIGGDLSSHGGGNSYFDTTGPMGGNWAYRVIGGKQNEDYWRNFGYTKRTYIMPQIAYNDDKWSFNLSYQYLDYDNPVDRGAMWTGGSFIGNGKHRLDEPWSRSTGHRHTINSTTSYHFNDHNQLRFTAAFNQDKYHDNQVDSRSYDAATGSLARRYRSQDGAQRNHFYASLDWISTQHLFGMKNDLVMGADYQTYSNHTGAFYQTKNQQCADAKSKKCEPGTSSSDLFYPSHPEYGNLQKLKEERANEYQHEQISGESVYAKDNLHLTDHWILSPGVRLQRFDIKNTQGAGADRVQTTDESKTKALPFLGLVYRPIDRLSFYADYSESFKPNEFSSDDPVVGSYKPQEGSQVEGGIKYDDGTWVSNLAVYHIKRKNVATTTADGDQRLIGEARSNGVEWDLTGHLTNNLDLLANYAYTNTKVLDDPSDEGNRLPNVPHNAGGLYLAYGVPQDIWGGHLRFGGGGRYVGKREGDTGNSFTVPSYTTFDAFVGWDTTHLLGKRTSFQLNAVNLTNRTIYTASGENKGRISLGEDRTFRLKTEVTF